MKSAMQNPAPDRRRGMTLVELLVVVVILSLLSVAVLPNLSNTAEGRRFREAARGISSFVARAQSRAINAASPRGFMIQPLAAAPGAGIDLFMADSPPPYGGEDISSTVTVVAPETDEAVKRLDFLWRTGNPPAVKEDTNTLSKLRSDASFAEGDSIQFGGLGPTYRLTPASGTVGMWTSVNQNAANTPWPRTPLGGVPYRIIRQPRRASTAVFQTQRGTAIDIASSCLGARPLFDPAARPEDRIIQDIAQPVVLLFDAAGRPTEIVHSGGMRERVTEPLFLLVGSPDLAGQSSGANWQQQDSVWLCVDNHTGVVKFGVVTPGAANVVESQWHIRQTVGLGSAE
jgi:prepilin-type N-terminal cleavage/methylation domain-containing protein